MKSIRDVDVREKTIFLRVDFNVPLKNGKITDDNRIKAATPTIKYLIEKKAKVILGTHFGRPGGKFESIFSTIPIAQEVAKILNQQVHATDHVTGPIVEKKVSNLKPGEILFLGNLRFDQREELNDPGFAEELAKLADLYVNDAFAVSHRANASVDAITKFLPSYSGLLFESEITTLGLLLSNPNRPFILIVGGAKVKDKAGILENLAEKADTVLIGGIVANTFLSAQGKDMGVSLVDVEMVPKCKEILEKFGNKIKLPTDFEKENKPDGSFNCLDIGSETRQRYAHEIDYAKTVFWNGNMGYTEDERFCQGTKAIAEAMVKNQITTVIAGGDTVGFIDANNLNQGISFISTGGSAAMEFLAGKKLPGIDALDKATL